MALLCPTTASSAKFDTLLSTSQQPPPPQLVDNTLRLPDHVLLLVFKYFNAYECLNLSTVCWRWYNVIQSSPLLWRNVWFLRPARELVDCPLFKRGLDVGKYLRRLTIDRAVDLDLLVCLLRKAGCCNIESLSLLGDPQRQLFFPISPTLTPLAVDFICWLGSSLTSLEVAFGVDVFLDTNLARILSACKNLKSLSLYGTRQNFHDPVFSYERIPDHDLSLTRLHLEIRLSRVKDLIRHLLPRCPLIEEFILEDHDGPMLPEEWDAIDQQLLPQLKTFTINLCDSCTVTEYYDDDPSNNHANRAEIVIPFSHIPANLRLNKKPWKSLRVRIEYQEHLEEPMSHIFHQCSQVEELKLCAHYKTEEALEYHDNVFDIYGPIPQHMPNLRHLIIGGYAVLSGYIINMVQQAKADGTLPYLETVTVVDLSGRAAYSRSWFVDLVSLPSVRCLEIRNCQSIITRDHVAFLTDIQLEKVSFYNMRLDHEWIDALGVLKVLKRLDISFCSGIKDSFLRNLVDRLSTVSTLLLQDYQVNISEEAFQYVDHILSSREGSLICTAYPQYL